MNIFKRILFLVSFIGLFFVICRRFKCSKREAAIAAAAMAIEVLVAISPTQQFNSNVNNINDNYTSKVKLVKIDGSNNPSVNLPVNPPSDLRAPSNFPTQNVPRKCDIYIPLRSGPHLATTDNNDPGKPDPDPNSEFDNHQKKQRPWLLRIRK